MYRRQARQVVDSRPARQPDPAPASGLFTYLCADQPDRPRGTRQVRARDDVEHGLVVTEPPRRSPRRGVGVEIDAHRRGAPAYALEFATSACRGLLKTVTIGGMGMPAAIALLALSAGLVSLLGRDQVGARRRMPGQPGGRRRQRVDQWGDIVSELGGSCAQVTTVVAGSVADPRLRTHPADAVAFATRRLVVVSGGHYDDLGNRLAAGSAPTAPVVTAVRRTPRTRTRGTTRRRRRARRRGHRQVGQARARRQAGISKTGAPSSGTRSNRTTPRSRP